MAREAVMSALAQDTARSIFLNLTASSGHGSHIPKGRQMRSGCVPLLACVSSRRLDAMTNRHANVKNVLDNVTVSNHTGDSHANHSQTYCDNCCRRWRSTTHRKDMNVRVQDARAVHVGKSEEHANAAQSTSLTSSHVSQSSRD